MSKTVVDLFATEALLMTLPDGRRIMVSQTEAGGMARLGVSVPPAIKIAPEPVDWMPLDEGSSLLTLKRSIGERIVFLAPAGIITVWLLSARNGRTAKVQIHAPRDVRIWRGELGALEDAA